MENVEEEVTLFDRIGTGIFTGSVAFLTGIIVWLLVIVWANFNKFVCKYGFICVIAFTLFITIYGFLLKINLIANILGKIWQTLYKTSKWGVALPP